MRPETPGGASVAGSSVASMPQDRHNKLRHKLLGRVMAAYQSMHGPPLGPTGRVLMETELELLMARGVANEVDLRRVATKVLQAQHQEDDFRSQMGSRAGSRAGTPAGRGGGPNASMPLRPASSCSNRGVNIWNAGKAGGPLRSSSPLNLPPRASTPLLKSTLQEQFQRAAGGSGGGVGSTNRPAGLPLPLPLPTRNRLVVHGSADEAPAAGAFGGGLYNHHHEHGEDEQIANSREFGDHDSGDPGVQRSIDVRPGDVSEGLLRELDNLPQDLPAFLRPPMSPSKMGPVLRKKYNERLANAEWEAKIKEDVDSFTKKRTDELRERTVKQKVEKENLARQMDAWTAIKDQQRALDDAFAAQENEKKRQWDEEQKAEEQRSVQQRKRERESLKTQIASRDQQRKDDDNRRRAEEEAYANLVAQEHRQRKDDEKSKRDRERSEIRAFLNYNDELVEKKKRQKSDDIEEEKKALKEYSEYLDKKELEYKDNLKRISDKQFNRVHLATQTYFKSLWEMEQRDTAKAAREQSELQQKLRNDDMLRRQRIQEENKKMKDMLEFQVQEKLRLRDEENAEKVRMRLKLEAEVEAERQANNRQRQAGKIDQLRRARELEEQVASDIHKSRNPMQIKIMGRS